MDRPARAGGPGGGVPRRRGGGAFSVGLGAASPSGGAGWPARAAPAALALALGVAYALIAPRTGDLPAHVFRAELFGREGFTVWNGQWYSGHHTAAYSLLFPPLAWALGPWLAGAASAVAAVVLFEPLAQRRFGPRGGVAAALLFALGMGATLFAGRLTFALGAALAIGALLALELRRGLPGVGLAAGAGLASPAAGAFAALVALVAAGAALRHERHDAMRAVLVALTAIVPPAALALAFPEGGRQPFVASSLLPAVVLTLLVAAVVSGRERALRAGAVLYGVAMIASFVTPTPMGGIAVRLGQLVGAALAAGALLAHPATAARRAVGAALVAGLMAWSLTPAVRDLSNAVGEPSTEAVYFAPLVAFLDRVAGPADRVEIPLTREHWEAAEVAGRLPLARGWLRSTDIAANPLFYRDGLDDATYERWLREHGVRYVALADAPLDYSAREEAGLVAREPTYLRLRWRSAHWRVYELAPTAANRGAVRVTALAPGGAALEARRPGRTLVRVRYTPYWSVGGGCVKAAGEWTLVTLAQAGPARLRTDFSPARVGRRDARCTRRDGR